MFYMFLSIMFLLNLNYTPIDKPNEFPSYYITEEDKDLLLKVGVCEAGGSDSKSIGYVMQVVLNRVFESEYFPASISDVVYQRNQFSTVSILEDAIITDEAYQALEDVIYGTYKDFDGLFFESLPGRIWEGRYDYILSYGGHDFYTIKEIE